ncbi:MAG: hypothetical protein NT003_04770 [Candidatus Magasanikbacteria bacterium]|nr:hypothetical protein [Candidatus Magasanikbacteria bacterium]
MDEMVRNPLLDRMPGEGLGIEMGSERSFERQPKATSTPLPPVMCEVDYDTPLFEQLEALDRAGFLHLFYSDNESLQVLRDLPSPKQTGKILVQLEQHTFGTGKDTFQEIGKRPLPDSKVFKDPYHFVAYLRRNKTVGLSYQFACALPCTDGQTWLQLQRYDFKRTPCRALCVRTGDMKALTSWYYLVG